MVVIEDVITGGTSFSETLPLLKKYQANVLGVIVGVDRQERGVGELPALADVAATWGVRTAQIVTISDVVSRLHNRPMLDKIWIDDTIRARIDAYLREFGAH